MGTVYHQKLFLFLFFLDSFVQTHIFTVVIHFIWKSSSYDIVQWYSCKTVCNFKDNFSWFLKSFLFCVFFFCLENCLYCFTRDIFLIEFAFRVPCSSSLPIPLSCQYLLPSLWIAFLSPLSGRWFSSFISFISFVATPLKAGNFPLIIYLPVCVL